MINYRNEKQKLEQQNKHLKPKPIRLCMIKLLTNNPRSSCYTNNSLKNAEHEVKRLQKT